MRRLICAFVVRIWHKTHFLMAWLNFLRKINVFARYSIIRRRWIILAATWQNIQNDCAPSEDSDPPGHPPSLIRVFAVRVKKAWVLSYPISAQRRLIRMGRCLGWSESSLGAHSFCWFCHVAAHLLLMYFKSGMLMSMLSPCFRVYVIVLDRTG